LARLEHQGNQQIAQASCITLRAASRAGGWRRQTAGRVIMTEDAIVLDERRGMAAQHETEIRRRLSEVEADQATLRERRTALEQALIAAPARSWQEAADKARYLIGLLATTSLARDPRRQKLIAGVLDDFARLAGEPAAARGLEDEADVRARPSGAGGERRS
jgi:hypothetical protein